MGSSPVTTDFMPGNGRDRGGGIDQSKRAEFQIKSTCTNSDGMIVSCVFSFLFRLLLAINCIVS